MVYVSSLQVLLVLHLKNITCLTFSDGMSVNKYIISLKQSQTVLYNMKIDREKKPGMTGDEHSPVRRNPYEKL